MPSQSQAGDKQKTDPKDLGLLLMELPPLQKRAKILLFFLFLWAALVAAHLFYYSIWSRDYYLERGRKLSEKDGIIPAMRGMIIDNNKIPLAWNERYYDLFLRPYAGFPSRQKRIFRSLHRIFPNIQYRENETEICLKRNLPPTIQLKCAEIIKYFPELELRPRVIRIYIDSPELQNYLGKTENLDGKLRGISGLEKKYNGLLKGKNGYFTVMADRFGNWIPGTWEEKQQTIPGQDLVLEKSVEELKFEIGN